MMIMLQQYPRRILQQRWWKTAIGITTCKRTAAVSISTLHARDVSLVQSPNACHSKRLYPITLYQCNLLGCGINSWNDYCNNNNWIQPQKRYYSTSRQHQRGRIPRMSEMRSLEEALAATNDNLDRLSPRDVSAFWAVVPKFLGGRLPKTNKQQQQQMFHQFDKISTRSIQDIDQYDPRDMSTLAISLAKIIDKISKRKRPAKGSPHQILQDILIGNESKIKQYIFREIASASVPILHEFDARHLSNLIYSYGLAEYVIKFDDGSTLFDVFAQAAIPNLHTFNGQDLSNMLWSYANVKVSNSQLFEQAGDYIVGLGSLHSFKPQHLSNIVWAYATLDEQHPWLFKKVAAHIVQLDNLHEFWPQALKDIVWAFATAREQHPKLFKKVADHIVGLNSLSKFEPQHFSNTLWALATAEESHPQLLEKVADHIISLDSLRSFNEQALSNTVWAFASTGVSSPQLFKKVAYEAIERQHNFTSQGVANFLWAYATNGQVDEHLFSSLTPSVQANLDEYNEQNLINVAWAYSVANVEAPSVFNDEFINACLKREENGFILEHLRQLHQWQLWQDEIKSDVSLPESLKKKCYKAFISEDPTQSKLQDDVASSLSSMGLQPQEEVLLKSGYRIDAVVEVDEKQIAVEVDGPSHFIGRELTGSTILKHRQVAALDEMSIVSVPYWDWNKLKKDSRKKEQYLRSLLLGA